MALGLSTGSNAYQGSCIQTTHTMRYSGQCPARVEAQLAGSPSLADVHTHSGRVPLRFAATNCRPEIDCTP